jgi:hypothetical protein
MLRVWGTLEGLNLRSGTLGFRLRFLLLGFLGSLGSLGSLGGVVDPNSTPGRIGVCGIPSRAFGGNECEDYQHGGKQRSD